MSGGALSEAVGSTRGAGEMSIAVTGDDSSATSSPPRVPLSTTPLPSGEGW